MPILDHNQPSADRNKHSEPSAAFADAYHMLGNLPASSAMEGLQNSALKVAHGFQDHLQNTSTMRLAEEGAGLAIVAAASIAAIKKAPQLLVREVAPTLKGAADGLAELGSTRLPANLTAAGADLRFKVTEGALARNVTVHLPPGFHPDKPTSVYYLLDGVQVGNPAGNMLGINGWARTADKHNLVAVNIEQAEQSSLRVFGLRIPRSIGSRSIPNVTSWSTDHGLLNKTRAVDDVKLFASVHSSIQGAMNVEAHNVVTFSDGATLANTLAARMPAGSLNGVANVAGTIMKDAPLPQPGIKGFFVNSIHDPTIPIDGGPGPQLTKWLPKVGQRNILKSAPELQGPRYAEANGIKSSPEVTETPIFKQHDYVSGAGEGGEVKVRTYTLKKGGHTWPGRDVGDGTSTALTKANGDTVSHDEFATNERIVQFFKRGGTISRSLEAK